MIKDKCNITASCKECPYYNGFECEATERQRAFIGKYSGYGKIELMSVCYDKDEKIAELEKAFELAVFELDFYKNHSQSTSQECIERIERLRTEIWNRAKEMMKSE